MAFLDAQGDFPAFVGEDQAAVFFVVDVAEFAELLHHAGDRGLLDLKGGSDIDDAGVSFFLDQFMDALEIVLRTLTWHQRRRHRLNKAKGTKLSKLSREMLDGWERYVMESTCRGLMERDLRSQRASWLLRKYGETDDCARFARTEWIEIERFAAGGSSSVRYS